MEPAICATGDAGAAPAGDGVRLTTGVVAAAAADHADGAVDSTATEKQARRGFS